MLLELIFCPHYWAQSECSCWLNVMPQVQRIALLLNPDNVTVDAERRDAEMGARTLGRETLSFNARNQNEIDVAFRELMRQGAEAFITGTDPVLLDRRHQLIAYAQQHKLPAVYFVKQFADAGGLISYAPSITW